MWRKIPALLVSQLLYCSIALGQSPSDCDGAIVICSDGPIDFTPSGIDFDDYSDSDNDPGCLLTFENRSVWYYFEFRDDMPPNSIIEFVIDPDGGFGEDYDFAIYGPNVSCDSLGEPVRCSFANFLCTECPLTGLGNGATDTSEGAENEDGFVAPMMVQPGQGFFMILDNWYGSSSGFQLTWGGSAAPYLNCLADPACSNYTISTGADIQLCARDTALLLPASVTGFGPGTIYTWTADNGLDALLDTTQLLNPTLLLSDTLSGNFVLRITAQRNNCIETDSIAVSVIPAPAVTIAGDSLACTGSTVALDAGLGFVAYLWSNDSTSQIIQALAGQSYAVTVTDTNGCAGNDTLYVGAYTAPDPLIQGNNLLCQYSSITLGAPPGYVNWTWSTGSVDSAIVISSADDYSLTVTDVNGCQFSDTLSVAVAPLPQPFITGDTAFCTGGQTILDAGAGFTTYSWLGGGDAVQLQVTSPGAYSVTVTDANGCLGTDTIEVVELPLPIPQINGALTYCANDATALSVSGTYSAYLWTTLETSDAIVFAGTGQVGVLVTDANGCQGQAAVTIAQWPLPQIDLGAGAAFCPGESVLLDAGPGFSNYSWTGGLNLQAIEVSIPGQYAVTVTDANGCSVVDSIAVAQLAPPLVQLSAPPGLCPGAMATLSTVTPFVDYSWSAGGAGSAITVDQPGIYSVTVTDVNGCSGADTVQINALSAPQVNIQGGLKLCENGSTILDAGSGFTTYNWTGAVSSPTLVVSAPGNYGVTVTDANGCQGSAGVTVVGHQVSPPPIPSQTAICEGETAFFNAGTSYLSYSWPDGTTGTTFSTSLPGIYNLIVIDTANCLLSVPFEVVENSLPSVQIVGPASLCVNDSINLTANAVYPVYQWSTGEGTIGITITTPGLYELTVEDANGCRNQSAIIITAFPIPDVTISGSETFCEGTATVLQATPGFVEYDWNTNHATDQLVVDAAGLYAVTVTDINGCRASASAEVTMLDAPELSIEGSNFLCAGSSTLLQATGNFVSVIWNDNDPSNPVMVDQPGIYEAVATGANGCITAAAIIIQQEALPVAQAGIDQQINCLNTNVQIGTQPGTGQQNWVYNWQGPGITPANAEMPQPVVHDPGIYILVISDMLSGCISIPDSVAVSDARLFPIVSPTVTDTIDCNTTVANITSQGSSAGSDFVYQWLDGNGQPISGQIGSTLQVSTPGSYSLSIINTLNWCADTASVTVAANFQYPDIDAGPDQTLNCYATFLQLNGSIANAGSSEQFEINWQTAGGQIISGNQVLDPAVDRPGVYTLNVTSLSTGCTATDSAIVSIDTIAPVAIVADSLLSIDCINAQVTLTAAELPTGQHFEAAWLNALGQPVNPSVNQPGVYTLQVTNTQNGCSGFDEVLVTLLDNYPRAEHIQVLSPKCYGDATGVIQIVSVRGGQPPYQYIIDDVLFDGQSGLNQLSSGAYDLEIIDVNGCRWDTAIIIQPGTDPQIELGDDQYVKLGESFDIEVQLNLSDDAISRLFLLSSDTLLCEDCREYTIAPWRTTAIVGEVVDTNGCIARDVLYLYVDQTRRVYIPNVFSPNGDGKNDRFFIFGDSDVKIIRSLTILHRWGGKVYEGSMLQVNNPGTGWDGNFLGKPHNNGVFVYVAEIEFIDGSVELFKGDLTLLR